MILPENTKRVLEENMLVFMRLGKFALRGVSAFTKIKARKSVKKNIRDILEDNAKWIYLLMKNEHLLYDMEFDER